MNLRNEKITALWDFVVDLPNNVKDTIKVGDKDLYLETKFNPFAHRNTKATVIATPVKRPQDEIKVGDEVFLFHHSILEKQLELDSTGLRRARFNPQVETIDIIAYKRDGEIKPFWTWVICEKNELPDERKTNAGITILKGKDDLPFTAVIAFDSPRLKEEGITKGDTIRFYKHSDYEVEMDGKKYWCMKIGQIEGVISNG